MLQHVCNFERFKSNGNIEFYFPITVIAKDKWETIMSDNNWNNVELRDNRYNQIIHMVSAAKGAEEFYSTEVKINKKKRTQNVFNKNSRLGAQL